ncbi:MAG: hypothetical protein IPK99_13330 [Flavobacteriales bacterium]|nr:hypothetical protein [Flavobacteriales bacterium]
MKNLLALALCAILYHAVPAQSSGGTIIVRATETWIVSKVGFTDFDAAILVTNSDGTSEWIELDEHGIKNFEENTKTIQRTLDKYFNDSYELVSQLATGNDVMNNYIWMASGSADRPSFAAL